MMGYQESVVYTNTKAGFNKMINTYIKLKKRGAYSDPCTVLPVAVIELKKQVGDLPKGKKLLWVCGDRGFHNKYGVFPSELPIMLPVNIMAVEKMFPQWEDEFKGLNFNIDFSENDLLKHYSIDTYINEVHKKEHHKNSQER